MPTKILVVDDQHVIADTIVQILNGVASNEFAAEAAYTGKDAVEKARKIQPDLVLLDVILPDTTGLEHALEIRDKCGCNVLLISGNIRTAEVLTESEGREVSPFEILAKPIHPLELIDRVRNAVRSRSGTGNASQKPCS